MSSLPESPSAPNGSPEPAAPQTPYLVVNGITRPISWDGPNTDTQHAITAALTGARTIEVRLVGVTDEESTNIVRVLTLLRQAALDTCEDLMAEAIFQAVLGLPVTADLPTQQEWLNFAVRAGKWLFPGADGPVFHRIAEQARAHGIGGVSVAELRQIARRLPDGIIPENMQDPRTRPGGRIKEAWP